MRNSDEPPFEVREFETVWIPMPDGCRLAARLWLPVDAETNPVPAILEYIPYRRRDGTRLRDASRYRYYAGHGYACLRVDLRGAGDSDGHLAGEYLEREIEDGAEVIAWIAAQPWCTGRVGMTGISWGGFNSLQVAALRPPALKAIITVASTDDRYADDIHYMGGCLICENLMWASTMFGFNSRPPDPEVVGEGWREAWMARLEGNEPWIIEWLSHQRRDEFWRHGSVCEGYAAIECAVYAVGGWADGYSNAVPRLLANLSAPRKGLVGPWPHVYPHEAGPPGPAIGYLRETLRWWDHWLKEVDTGIMAEPMLRVWMQDSVPPAPQYEVRPGRWVAEDTWPSMRIETRTLVLDASGLADAPRTPSRGLAHRSPQALGTTAGDWCPHGNAAELPPDQRIEDGGSLVFDTEPLEDTTEILGAPVVRLDLSSDRPVALVAVRLNDVAPAGESTRVSYGLLNLTHRDGHDAVTPLVPGERYTVEVRLNDIAHAFPPGHRIRVAISTTYWPLAWPSPEPVTLTVHTGTSTLELPVRPPRNDDRDLAPFEAPEVLPMAAHTARGVAHRGRFVETDLATGRTLLRSVRDRGRTYIDEIDLELGARLVTEMTVTEGRPLSASNRAHQTMVMERGAWRIRTETDTVVTATAEEFLVTATLDAFEGDTRVFSKAWQRRIARDGI